ncbi:MAG TPA: alpha/beta hydrolase [Opitutaceae bacterium]|nr:alpha/beta hydrolase [Opitutaceae bacterium]
MSLSEQFAHYRETHPIFHRMVAGHDWSYIVSGSGAQTVVILPGGGGCDPECMFPVVAALEPQCRVIEIGYAPTATTVQDLIEGVRAILDNCGVEHCCLLGHSLGGFVERAFVQAYPQRVEALIIANSTVYTPGRALLIKAILPISFVLPRSVMLSVVRSKFSSLLKTLPEADREFWMGYVDQSEMVKPGSQSLRNQAHCMLDFIRHGWDKPVAVPGWNGRVLIIESSEETGFTLKERQILRAHYPGATVHIIQGAGHGSFMTHPQEFNETVTGFLAEKKS